ncbi:DUF981 family protein [Listeria aquatica]|uniref:DUF981 family protein n=1 Tax=Listeria aquatica TaxID=1494960 RepID=UPI0031F4FBF4
MDSWVVGFAIPGFILTLTGAHMSLTWPLSKIGFPFDDIIFGEPVLAFGILLLAAAYLLHRRNHVYVRDEKLDARNDKLIAKRLQEDLPGLLKPLSYFGAAMGLALIAIGIAGITFQLFAAPKEEPISGLLADYLLKQASSLCYTPLPDLALCFPTNLKEESCSRTSKNCEDTLACRRYHLRCLWRYELLYSYRFDRKYNEIIYLKKTET